MPDRDNIDIALLKKRVDDLEKALDKTEKELREFHREYDRAANRYGGMFAVVLGIGGAIGWIVSIWYYIKSAFAGHGS